MAYVDPSSLTVPQLIEELVENWGIPKGQVRGLRKAELVKRLSEIIAAETGGKTKGKTKGEAQGGVKGRGEGRGEGKDEGKANGEKKLQTVICKKHVPTTQLVPQYRMQPVTQEYVEQKLVGATIRGIYFKLNSIVLDFTRPDRENPYLIAIKIDSRPDKVLHEYFQFAPRSIDEYEHIKSFDIPTWPFPPEMVSYWTCEAKEPTTRIPAKIFRSRQSRAGP